MRYFVVVCAAYFLMTGTTVAKDWSGFHVGAHLGGTWSSVDYFHNETLDDNVTSDPSGVSGGLQIGAQQQFGSFVAGVEAALTFQDLDDTFDNTNRADRNRITLVDNMWSIAARLGYTQGPWLGYFKVGYANADIGFRNTEASTGTVLGASEDDVGGLLLGAGFEYAIGNGFTLGADYTYINFNADDQVQLDNTGAPAGATNEDIDADLHQLSVRLNYRFNWGHRHDPMK